MTLSDLLLEQKTLRFLPRKGGIQQVLSMDQFTRKQKGVKKQLNRALGGGLVGREGRRDETRKQIRGQWVCAETRRAGDDQGPSLPSSQSTSSQVWKEI